MELPAILECQLYRALSQAILEKGRETLFHASYLLVMDHITYYYHTNINNIILLII